MCLFGPELFNSFLPVQVLVYTAGNRRMTFAKHLALVLAFMISTVVADNTGYVGTLFLIPELHTCLRKFFDSST